MNLDAKHVEPLIPVENLRAYSLLYVIEVGLREFIIDSLDKLSGHQWWKTRLPPDVVPKVRAARSYERSVAWMDLVPHHPLYYIDFTDLDKIIERSDNWRDVFQDTFADQSVLRGSLRELEPIRNKVAHNRRVSPREESVVRACYNKIASALGDDVLKSLLGRAFLATDIPRKLNELREEVRVNAALCRNCGTLTVLEVWKEVRDSWWFDNDYLCFDVAAISDFFTKIAEYQSMPRIRGIGHQLEKWVHENRIEEMANRALSDIAILLEKEK